jgi:hypothetical protein
MNIEQKTEALRKRWEELQPKSEPKPTPKSTYQQDHDHKIDGSQQAQKSLEDTVDYVMRFLRSYAPIAHNSRGVQKGGKNENERLGSLKEPITWVGNLAVGEDKYIKGLWKIVPPVGISITYSGEGAKEEALRRAESIRYLY